MRIQMSKEQAFYTESPEDLNDWDGNLTNIFVFEWHSSVL